MELREQGLAWVRKTSQSNSSVEQFATVISKKLMEPPQPTRLAVSDLHEAWIRYAEINFGSQIRSYIAQLVMHLGRSSAFRPFVQAIRNTSFGKYIRRGLRVPKS
jgi:hypothetical protein